MKEIWKDIKGYEGKYQVSSEGRVKSLKRKVKSKNWYSGNEFYRTIQERILKPGRFCKSGHLSVVLGRGSNGKPVHQLVAEAFIGECPVNMEVLHINGNPKDNRLINLRYGTRTENIIDVYKNNGRWRKLTIDDVYNIRFHLLCGFKGVEISKLFKISETTVSSIKNGRTFWWLR